MAPPRFYKQYASSNREAKPRDPGHHLLCEIGSQFLQNNSPLNHNHQDQPTGMSPGPSPIPSPSFSQPHDIEPLSLSNDLFVETYNQNNSDQTVRYELRRQAILGRQATLKDLKSFSLQLKAPIPKDLLPILGRDEHGQKKAIVGKKEGVHRLLKEEPKQDSVRGLEEEDEGHKYVRLSSMFYHFSYIDRWCHRNEGADKLVAKEA